MGPRSLPGDRAVRRYKDASKRHRLIASLSDGDPRQVAEHPRIAFDPDVLVGKPVIRGTRLAVEFVIGLLADGWTEAEIIANYSGVAHEDILACLAYARDVLSSEKVFPSAA
jgi:uncharacterized protein (DUF433 family)